MKNNIEKYRSKGKFAPNNLYTITEKDLLQLGFQQRAVVISSRSKQIATCEEGDFLCALEVEKTAWIKLDLNYSKKIDPNHFLVYYLPNE